MGSNIEYLERRISVRIRSRGNLFEIHGSQKQLEVAEAVLRQLYVETNEREEIDVEFLQVFLQESELEGMVEKGGTPNSSIDEGKSQQFEDSLVRTRKKTIKPRGANQSSYVGRVRSHDICFGIGPAGTGKTYLAVA
ncbi:MAG: PhoH family protein, partial [Gammaproteobacteria bacterium]|nr:PhoH family protein [Gammaproteobacteria bacterium]